MKKLIRTLLLSAIMFSLLSLTAFADMGSKPRVQITVENQPQEKYYLDLLYYAGDRQLHANTVWIDDGIYTTLYNYNDNGWIPALAQGTSIPMWGEFEPDENGVHILSYFGVPDEFKIIIVTESGEIKISDTISRKTMEISLTLDYTDMSYTAQPVWRAILAQFAVTCCMTLLVEFVVLMLFYAKEKANIKPFFVMNIITQLFLTVAVSRTFMMGGTFSVYMIFPLAELIIFIFEIWYSRKFFVGDDYLKKLGFAITANAVSLWFTFLSLDKIMDIMFKLIR